MRNSVKAAIATSAAAVLLLGGAGSLAYWQTAGAATPGSMQAGKLALVDGTSDTWTLNGAPVTDPAAVRIVPGDQLVWDGTFVLDAEGDNIKAEVAMTGGDASGTLSPYVTSTVTWTVDGQPASTTITKADDGKTVAVRVTVDFPIAAANAAQSMTLNLSNVNVTLTQVDASPAA